MDRNRTWPAMKLGKLIGPRKLRENYAESMAQAAAERAREEAKTLLYYVELSVQLQSQVQKLQDELRQLRRQAPTKHSTSAVDVPFTTMSVGRAGVVKPESTSTAKLVRFIRGR